MIVLDTHAWVWWVAGGTELSAGARAAIDAADRIGVSTVSCWEVARLVDRGRLRLDRPVARWVRAALRADERTTPMAPDADVAVAAATLGSRGFHGDPADRFIYATARAAGSTLVTRDRRIRAFDADHTVW